MLSCIDHVDPGFFNLTEEGRWRQQQWRWTTHRWLSKTKSMPKWLPFVPDLMAQSGIRISNMFWMGLYSLLTINVHSEPNSNAKWSRPSLCAKFSKYHEITKKSSKLIDIHFYLTNCFDGKKIQIRIEEISVVVH